MDKKAVVHIHNGILLIHLNTFESVLMRWMKLEPVIQSEVSQKEKHQYSISSVQLLSRVQLFGTPRTAVHQASLSFTISWSLLKLMSIESGTPSNHVILCRPLLLPPSIFPSIRIFSHESALHIRWPKLWSFSFSISPSSEYSGWFPLGWTGLISKGLSRVFSNTTLQKHQFFGAQPSTWSDSHIHPWLLEKP